MNFKKIQLSDKKTFDEYYCVYPQNSNYLSFASMYLWRGFSDVEFCFLENDLILKGNTHVRGINYFALPQTNEHILKKSIDAIKDEYGDNILFLSLTEEQIKQIKSIYGKTANIKGNLDSANYIYETERLQTLAGKKLHTKRNHINKFKSLYDYEYINIDKKIASECYDIAKIWFDSKSEEEKDDYMIAELGTCKEALQNMDELGLSGGALKVDGKIVAFSLGEYLNPKMAHILIEKANVEYEGSYSVINNEFIKHCFESSKYVNREEDMGIEGLRRAKSSYNPAFLLKMFDVRI